eukprot:CAMPEP_0175803380 /NCGR_PEP_ID=MMETSP0097-20121207/88513_1 /TAXON_ID=311494 /ORGANISM="Alexandrium monilatum, Strain CCMP3105" /LENGTH=162 /DNA_ID=CAMNT_0017114719 /DNA_START=72 /DNA_END=555 /DNA_ORIENTATION=+
MEAVHAMTSEDTPVPEIEEEVKEEEDLLKGLQRVILEQEDADMGGGESDVARSTASAMQPAPQQPAAAAAQAEAGGLLQGLSLRPRRDRASAGAAVVAVATAAAAAGPKRPHTRGGRAPLQRDEYSLEQRAAADLPPMVEDADGAPRRPRGSAHPPEEERGR